MDKSRMYEASGEVLATVAEDLGVRLGTEGRLEWARIMKALAGCDSIAESNPESYLEITNLATQLGLPDTQEMYSVLNNLLDESILSERATCCADHLDHRELEAKACTDMLRLVSAQFDATDHNYPWSQIEYLASAGIMMDTVSDAIMDTRGIVSQFSASQLMVGGTKRFVSLARKVHPYTWGSTIRASRHTGLDLHIAGKPIRVMRDLSAYKLGLQSARSL